MNSGYCANIQIFLLKDVRYSDIISDILRIQTDILIRYNTDILVISAMIPIHIKKIIKESVIKERHTKSLKVKIFVIANKFPET